MWLIPELGKLSGKEEAAFWTCTSGDATEHLKYKLSSFFLSRKFLVKFLIPRATSYQVAKLPFVYLIFVFIVKTDIKNKQKTTTNNK